MKNPILADFTEAELLSELLSRAVQKNPNNESKPSEDIHLLDMVDDFINQSAAEFNAKDVEVFIRENYGVDIKRATILGYLSKRKSDGLIKKIGIKYMVA